MPWWLPLATGGAGVIAALVLALLWQMALRDLDSAGVSLMAARAELASAREDLRRRELELDQVGAGVRMTRESLHDAIAAHPDPALAGRYLERVLQILPAPSSPPAILPAGPAPAAPPPAPRGVS